MGGCGRSLVCALASAACGPSPGDQGSASDESGESTSTGGSASDVDDGAPDSTEGGATSGRESETSSSEGETSSSEGESSSTTGEVFECECGRGETCFEVGTDNCNIGQTPRTTCIAIPAACEGGQPTCEGECGWEICGGPGCYGPHEPTCGYVSPGFVCSPYSGCNIFTQDCGRSEMCVSFDGDDNGSFDQTICTFPEGTVAVGEPCVGRHHVNGVDNCELGSMCVGESASSDTGICRAPCVGNPWNASCIDPAMQCVLDEWFFAWCLPA